MLRLGLVLLTALVFAGTTAVAQDSAAPVPATPENAAAFLGDWTLDATGNYGPATFALSLKAADGKVLGEVGSAATASQPVTDISKTATGLVLRYVLDYQGMPVNVVITLTPRDGKMTADLDFADGAAQMTGAATRKTS